MPQFLFSFAIFVLLLGCASHPAKPRLSLPAKGEQTSQESKPAPDSHDRSSEEGAGPSAPTPDASVPPEGEKAHPQREICFVRHGESIQNMSGGCGAPQSDTDALTEKGKKQALEAGRLIAKHYGQEAFVVYVSPFRRAQQTWEAILSVAMDSQPKVVPQRVKTEASVGECSPDGGKEACQPQMFRDLIAQVPERILVVSHYHFSNSFFKLIGQAQPNLGNAAFRCFMRS